MSSVSAVAVKLEGTPLRGSVLALGDREAVRLVAAAAAEKLERVGEAEVLVFDVEQGLIFRDSGEIGDWERRRKADRDRERAAELETNRAAVEAAARNAREAATAVRRECERAEAAALESVARARARAEAAEKVARKAEARLQPAEAAGRAANKTARKTRPETRRGQ